MPDKPWLAEYSPGVPAEMELMWRSYVEPEIRQLAGARQMVQRTLRCFGAGESDIEQMIPAEVMARGRDPLVGITASDATISLRVATYAESVSEGVSLIEPTLAVIRAALGELVYGQEDETLADAVIARLAARNETIAVVDLGLRGLVGQWLSESDPGGTVCLGTIDFRTPGSARRLFPQATADFPTSLDLERLARDVRDFWSAGLGVAIGPMPSPLQDESKA